MKQTLILFIYFVFSFSGVSAQQKLSVSGEVATPLELSRDDLAAFPALKHVYKDREGREHEFKGVALIDVLQKAGVTTGAKLRGENLTKLILVQAGDGYEVIYSLAEVDPEFSASQVLLVYEKDGAPLPSGEGPFRLVAPQDKKQARWIREVRTIKIKFAGE